MAHDIKQLNEHTPSASEKKKADKERKPQVSQTLMRGLDIIETVSRGKASIADIAEQTGMTYSTTHRILSALQQRHYITRDQDNGYRLGRKVLELGYKAYSQIDLTRLAYPLLAQLAKVTADTVHLGYAEGDTIIYLEKVASRRAVEISSRIGGSKPMISTGIGKALLLDQDDTQWAALYDRNAHILRDPISKKEWLSMMGHYAKLGYAFDLGEDESSIRCVAAPIYDSSRKIVAAISVSSTVQHMAPERMQNLAPLVKNTARQISMELGGSAP